MTWDLVVIGGGPAGLFAAGRAAQKGARVLVLEKQPEPGRKLLLTGSGQCNFTNDRPIREFFTAYGPHGPFLRHALMHFDNRAAREFFRRSGAESIVVAENGKVFPKSRRAADILAALLAYGRGHGVELRCRARVMKLSLDNDRIFSIRTPGGEYRSRRVLIATGGNSYPTTGSTGDGYVLAVQLGHAYVPPRPGLTSWIIRDSPLAGLAGTSFTDLMVTLWPKGGKPVTLSGDGVVTHHGLSGPVIQNLCRYAQAGDRATLALAPGAELPAAARRSGSGGPRDHGPTLKAWLKGRGLTQALARRLMERAAAQPATRTGALTPAQARSLLTDLTALPLQITRLGDLSTAMVTVGGVRLEEIDPKTMGSKKVPGLYFAGEVMDIDGDCGGYDLQAAWSTAALAADHMISEH